MQRSASALVALALYTFVLLPMAPAWAADLALPPDGDQIAPVIQYEPTSESVTPGTAVSIEATITDNIEVLEAILFYRPLGANKYVSVPMDGVGQGRYHATLSADQVTEPGVEYYIQASDKAGNMVMRGFAFSPLLLAVAPVFSVPAVPTQPAQVVPTKPVKPAQVVPTESATERLAMKTEPEAGGKAWYKKWWVWTIAGGVLVAAAAGGGGGGGNSTPSGGTDTLVTVTGPTP